MSPTPADHPESSAPSAEVDTTRFTLPLDVPPQPDPDLTNFGSAAPADPDLTNFGSPIPAGSDPRATGPVATPEVRHIGRYELLAELGRGGMGIVYKARDMQLHRLVAIKVIRGRDLDPEEALRFRHEAEAMARVQHPGVVQVFEVGEHDGKPYLAMEFCPGGGLNRYLAGTPLPPKEAATLVETLAQDVQAAHEQQVLHRDLKPATVLLTASKLPSSASSTAPGADSGTRQPPLATLAPKVSDFGLAKRLDEAGPTQSNAVMGTPSYMAPEQARGDSKKATAATDVYALGAILYECLTGRPPFKAANPMDTLLLDLHEEPQPPRRLQPQTPIDEETVSLKCLHKDPQRRYGSARELSDDLQRYRNGEAIRARSAGSIERSWRWCRRNPAVAGLLMAVVLALLLGTMVASLFAVQATRNAATAQKQTQEKEDQRKEADEQRRRAENESTEKDNQWRRAEAEKATAQRAEKKADAESRRFKSMLKAAQLVRVEPFRDKDPDRALSLLYDEDIYPTAEQDFVWGLYNHWCQRDRLTSRGHTEPVSAVSINGDGKVLASGSIGKTIKLWDVQTGQERATLEGHAGPVTSLSLSDDGKTLASGSMDETIKLWDVQTGQERATLVGHKGPVLSVSISGDGKILVSSSLDLTLKLWDVQTGQERATLEGHKTCVYCVSISRDGKTLASGGNDAAIKLWDVQTGTVRATFRGHRSCVTSVSFSRDGDTLASSGEDMTVKLWDVQTRKDRATLKGHTGPVYSVSISGDGKTLASGGNDAMIKLWDVQTGQERATLKGHTGGVSSVSFSGVGNTLVSGSFDKTIKLWDAQTGLERATLKGHKNAVHAVSFSGDGKTLASGSLDQTIKLWDVQTGLEDAPF